MGIGTRLISPTAYLRSYQAESDTHYSNFRIRETTRLIGAMAEGPAGDQGGGSVDTGQGVVIQQKQPSTLRVSRAISSPSSPASLSLAAPTPSSSPGRKKPGYYSENGYLMELSSQQRQRIQQEIKKRFKPGETCMRIVLWAIIVSKEGSGDSYSHGMQ